MAASAPAEGREVLGAPSLQEQFKLGWKGLKSSIEKQTAAAVDNEQSSEPKDSSGVDNQVSNLFAWAEKARKVVAEKVAYDAVPQDQPQETGADPHDVEKGEVKPWAMMAKAASNVKKQVAKAAEEADKNIKQGVQKAKSVEWGEAGAAVTKSMSRLAEQTNSAKDVLQDKGKEASKKAASLKDKTSEKLNEAKSNAGQAANKAKDKASAAAGAAKSKLSEAGQNVTGAVGGAAALAANPVKLAQFLGIFFVGCMLITLSFSFLPVLPIAPQKFSLLFAFGSLVIMGSIAFLKGPKALATQLIARDKLPFSGAYILGLVGTLVATIILRSFILTAVFGLLQAVALLYFLASYVPGGKAALNFCGRCTSRCTQKVCARSCSAVV
jgi:ElaB/YqjD/DUF883 family membrane-anchored ribosome-binding protein